MASFFYNEWGCSIASLEPLANWDVSNVSDMRYLFNFRSSKLTNLKGLENWDVSGATNMGNMFAGNGALSDISQIKNWDVGNVYSFQNMFAGTSLADASCLNEWTVKASESSYNTMFANCPLLAERPSKYPIWYPAYRENGSSAASASSLSLASAVSLNDASVVSRTFTSNAPMAYAALDENDNDPFDSSDYSTVEAARNNSDSGYFVADASGEAYYVFHLKGGTYLDMKDLPAGVQYEITEVGNDYLPSYTVTKGSEYTVSDSGKNEMTGSDLSTGKETLTAGSYISYLFTNKKDKGHTVTVEKQVNGGMSDPVDEFNYTAEVAGLEPGTEYMTKHTVAPVGKVERTFDFSKYGYYERFEEFPAELARALDGYQYIRTYSDGSKEMYQFSANENGLDLTCRYRDIDSSSYDYDEEYPNVKFLVKDQDRWGKYYINFYSAENGYSNSIGFTDRTEVAEVEFVDIETGTKTKTIDFTPYMRDCYLTMSSEDIQALDGAEFEGDFYNATYKFKAVDGKLQVTDTRETKKDGIISTEELVYTGDQLEVSQYGERLNLNLYDSEKNVISYIYIVSDSFVVDCGLNSSIITDTFTADENGNATINWTMKANDTFKIIDLPENATYKVTEAASEKYIPSYDVADNNADSKGTIVKTHDAKVLRNQALSTAEETVDLYEDVVITFTNTAPMPVLPSTGSNTALFLTLLGLAGIAGYGIYETLRRRKRNNMAV